MDEIAFEKEEESALKEMAALEGVAVWLRKSTFVLLSVPVDETSRARIHTSTILGPVDEGIFRSLGVQVTNEPVYATKSLYRKR